LPPSTSHDQTYVLDVTGAVQAMVDAPGSNYGFMIRLATEEHYRALQFWSREANDPAARPRLDVELPGGAP
jgi:hypothetical protein